MAMEASKENLYWPKLVAQTDRMGFPIYSGPEMVELLTAAGFSLAWFKSAPNRGVGWLCALPLSALLGCLQLAPAPEPAPVAPVDALEAPAAEEPTGDPEALAIVRRPARELTGRLLLDEEILREDGMTDFSGYAIDPARTLRPDLFLES